MFITEGTRWGWLFGIAMGGVLVCNASVAQITPDSTLPNNSHVRVQENIRIIEGGTAVGGNLFHSFQEFSVPTGGTAHFNNAVNIQNIISRVTGGAISNIDGLISANGRANLFLLNPSGIIFGANASLNVGGSFIGTTANNLKFADGSEFSSNPQQSTPLLTISAPIGLQLYSNQTGAIANAGNLAVKNGQNLSLIGSNVTNNGQLSATGGQVTVASVSQAQAFLGQTGEILSWEYQPKDISTTIISGKIDASNHNSGQTGGTVFILGDRVGLLDNALVNVSGDAGGGKVFLGGDYQGRGTIPLASATYISPSATINADALTTGNGGQIIVWGTESTRAYGSLSATGGIKAGNGGLIETSGGNFLDVAGIRINATATNGNGGTWLLDPRNVTLGYQSTSNGSFSDGNPNIFTPSGDNAVVFIPDIQAQLNAGTNVTITTGSTGSQSGNITATGFEIIKTNTTPATLTLQAANDITLQNFEISSNNAPLNLVLLAGNDSSGNGNVNLRSGSIETKGGAFTATAGGSVSLESFRIESNSTSVSNPVPITITGNDITLNNSSIKSNNNSLNVALQAGKQGSGSGNVRLNGGERIETRGGTFTVTAAGHVSLGDTSVETGGGGFTATAGGSVSLESFGIFSNSASVSNSIPIAIAGNEINLINSNIRSNNNRLDLLLKAGQDGSGSGNVSFSGGGTETKGGAFTVTATGNVLLDSLGISSNTDSENRSNPLNISSGKDITIRGFGITSNNILDVVLQAGKEGSGTGNVNLSGGSVTTRGGAFTAKAGDSVSIQGFGISSNNTNSSLNTANSITISSGKDITIKGNLTQNNNRFDVALQAGKEGSGTGKMSFSDGSVETGGGAFTATAGGSVSLEGFGISSNNNSAITAPINITADSVSIRSGSINSKTSNNGDAGLISINANSLNLLPGAGINTETTGNGNTRGINIKVGSLDVDNGIISSNTSGKGNAGNVTINSRSNINLKKGDLQSITKSDGNAGKVIVTAKSVSLVDGGGITTTARRRDTSNQIDTNIKGNAGDVTIDAPNILIDRSGLNSSTLGAGNAGSITIKTGSLTIQNSGLGNDTGIDRINNNTIINNTGNAGSWNITADAINFQNGNITSETGGSGNAGDIKLTVTNSLVLNNNSNIVNSTLGNSTGNAGRTEIKAKSVVFSNDLDYDSDRFSGLSSVTRGSGKAGEIILTADDGIVLRNRGRIGIGTESVGNAGQLTLSANSLELDNSNIISDSFSIGQGGNLILQLERGLILRDRSSISVSSTGRSDNSTKPGKAGDIQLRAGDVFLNQSTIKGEAGVADGGNIDLQIQDLLLLRNQSRISTNAGGNGGNITINTPSGFIIAVPQENSDITANAVSGSGGIIKINSLGVFGIEERSQQDLARLLGTSDPNLLKPENSLTNDITAISATSPILDGQVTINTPDVDPSRGLVQLPEAVVNTPGLIASGCAAFASEGGSSFTVTGRGGLPLSPDQPLSNDVVWSDTRIPATTQQQGAKTPTVKPSSQSQTVAIVPATGWVFNGKGEVTLISSVSNNTIPFTSTSSTCPNRSQK
ncbi:filamentous hemagglutinin N-terminal domain-containing protein [Iningainema tapete]|uniref:Filamentous hemagglutinin N-terminal domain-containing protein n=1 Tax=Iningainema tapete BLCC-T55 TaxID=2748662 RepID=A0A8J6XJR4_9CYAN|nr:filamentous hemagglutinin N-terminal domain-containing protein [Iningainema tapete]MBD2772789.1 filamentous hemagglutinin N-terminal domain-containing protein [Iningainema tapete BLCC-T55]